MQIITHVDAVNIDETIIPKTCGNQKLWDETTEEILSTLNFALEDQGLSDNYYIQALDAESSFIFGATKPQQVIEIAQAWNDHIREAFAAAVKEYTSSADSQKNLSLDNDATYKLRLAAEALDNHWVPNGSFGTFLPNEVGFPYFSVVLADKVVEDVKANPELYAVIDLSIIC